MTDFWDVMPLSLLNGQIRSGGTCCRNCQYQKWRHKFPPKRLYKTTQRRIPGYCKLNNFFFWNTLRCKIPGSHRNAKKTYLWDMPCRLVNSYVHFWLWRWMKKVLRLLETSLSLYQSERHKELVLTITIRHSRQQVPPKRRYPLTYKASHPRILQS
jgi:hypothetical protein